ncbi:DNA-binding transcriptional regulator YiaG [Virgibacillus halotolerans]|uniref:helix-turn-helix domain-containing protein n=1 Tax=Virgibacillus halotolerans TaxID=1071053 RepID=UPI001960CE08|nr:helix-turn-helix transcriptional regulator [Virgibacillus halotolerans]MBM7599974.1 DNA-binding transcriptional regulator YiaG [Virgibacillus halotolerans]
MKNNNTVETDDILSNNSPSINNWSRKINDFQVLVIYDEEGKHQDQNLSKVLNKNKIKGNTNIPIFQGAIKSDTFIIWQQSYQENKELFFKLRLNARNELIIRIVKVIVAYLLNKYQDYSTTSIHEHPKLKENDFIEKLIEKYDCILKNDSFLADYKVWDDFCNWFKTYLMGRILKDMEKNIGLSKLEKMGESQINDSFHENITNNLSNNSQFAIDFKNIVNSYVNDWITKIFTEMDIEKWPMSKITESLNLRESAIIKTRKDITVTLLNQGNLLVMSNAVYQSVRESISNNKFQYYNDTRWPTAILDKGSIKGTVQLKPIKTSEDSTTIQHLWSQAKDLSELDVDVFDSLCSYYLSKAKHHEDIVEIHLNDLLSMRGLKAKLGGGGRRGGYEVKQRMQILQALSKIQSLWINLEKIIVYEKGRPVQKALQGRAFIFKDLNHNDYHIERHLTEKKIFYMVGEVFANFLRGSGRQVAFLPIQALQYNPYHEVWEKKLTRYLSWRWRTQARGGDYLQPHKISTLLDAIGLEMNGRTPSRTRERLEKAFDILLEDGVIASWQYEKWNEDIAMNNGWSRIWENATIIIDPPELIKEQYRPIGKKRKVQTSHQKIDNQKGRRDLGKQIKELRKKLDLTLIQVADEIEISVSYLSNIERGMKNPSTNIKSRIEDWMRIYS